MDISYSCMAAPDHGEKRHPQIVMRAFGIEYHHAEPCPIADCWFFRDCKNIPAELPKFMEIIQTHDQAATPDIADTLAMALCGMLCIAFPPSPEILETYRMGVLHRAKTNPHLPADCWAPDLAAVDALWSYLEVRHGG